MQDKLLTAFNVSSSQLAVPWKSPLAKHSFCLPFPLLLLLLLFLVLFTVWRVFYCCCCCCSAAGCNFFRQKFFRLLCVVCLFLCRYARLHVAKTTTTTKQTRNSNKNKQSTQIVKLSAAFKARDYVAVNVNVSVKRRALPPPAPLVCLCLRLCRIAPCDRRHRERPQKRFFKMPTIAEKKLSALK